MGTIVVFALFRQTFAETTTTTTTTTNKQTKTKQKKEGKCLSEVTTVENRGNWLRLEKTLVALHAQNLSICLPVY